MTKSEIFVVAIISENNVRYAGINVDSAQLHIVENPIEIQRCFSHEDAHKVKTLMKTTKDFLKEGESVRVKCLSQCVRDYCGRLLQRGFDGVVLAGDETVKEVIATNGLVGEVKESKKEEKKAEAETVEPEAEKKEEVKAEEVKAEPTKKAAAKKKAAKGKAVSAAVAAA